MNFSDYFTSLTGAASNYFGSKETADAAKKTAAAQAAAAKSQLGIAQANSAWTKYIPLGIGALVVLGIAAFFLKRNK